jgi:hypothetical protein
MAVVLHFHMIPFDYVESLPTLSDLPRLLSFSMTDHPSVSLCDKAVALETGLVGITCKGVEKYISLYGIVLVHYVLDQP